MRRIAYLYIANEGGVDSSSRFEVIQLIVRIMYMYSTGVVLFCKIVCSHTHHTVWCVFPHTISVLTLLLWFYGLINNVPRTRVRPSVNSGSSNIVSHFRL